MAYFFNLAQLVWVCDMQMTNIFDWKWKFCCHPLGHATTFVKSKSLLKHTNVKGFLVENGWGDTEHYCIQPTFRRISNISIIIFFNHTWHCQNIDFQWISSTHMKMLKYCYWVLLIEYAVNCLIDHQLWHYFHTKITQSMI